MQVTSPTFCYADGMTSYLFSKKIRIFDHPKLAEPFRDELRSNCMKNTARFSVFATTANSVSFFKTTSRKNIEMAHPLKK